MAVSYFAYTGAATNWYSCACLSTDAKPANPPTDAICYEIDTARSFRAEGGAWVEKTNSAYTVAGHNHDGTYSPVGHTHAGGSDPWTYIKLAADFTTSSATAVDVTGLAFTPAANTQYIFESHLLVRTALATVNPRVGLAWPTGMTDGVADFDLAQTVSTTLLARGNIGAPLLMAVGGIPNTNQSWPAKLKGTVIAGATPSGTVKIQLASETAGTNVTAKAGSYLAYRVI